MASVALVVLTNLTSDYRPRAMRQAIMAGGHDCTIFPTQVSGQTPAALATAMAGFDVIFCAFLGYDNISDQTTYMAMLKTMFDNGKPMAIVGSSDIINASPLAALYSGGTLAGRIGMLADARQCTASDTDFLIDLRTSTDPILGGRTGLVNVNGAAANQVAFRTDSVAPQSEIIGWANPANASWSAKWGMILKCPRSSMSLLGTPFAANAAYIGFAVGGFELSSWLPGATPAGAQIIGNVITWLTGKYRLAGTVQDSGAAPLVRKVNAYASADGRLIGSTTSAGNGSFSIVTNTNESSYLVVEAADGTGPNGVIVANVTPVPYTPVYAAPTPAVIHHGTGALVTSPTATQLTAVSSNATNVGDLLVAVVHRTSAAGAIPAGWTLVNASSPAAGTGVATQYIEMYTKTAVLADIRGSFIFRQTTSGPMSVQVFSMFGTAGTPLVDTFNSTTVDNSTDLAHVFSTVTVAANTLSLAAFAYSVSSASQTNSLFLSTQWDNQGLNTAINNRLATGVLRSTVSETVACTGTSNVVLGANTAAVNKVILVLKPQ